MRVLELEADIALQYDRCGQHSDALDSYERAFDLGLRDQQCWIRLSALLQKKRNGTALRPFTLEMEDGDISESTCKARELEEDSSIEIARLHLEDESTSDGWQTSSNEDSDFENDQS